MQLNTELPESYAGAQDEGWVQYPDDKNIYHEWDGEQTIKMLSPDGHREAIYNQQTGALTTNPRNRGTYNRFDPSTRPVSHVLGDTVLYFQYGTGSDDPTGKLERVGRTLELLER